MEPLVQDGLAELGIDIGLVHDVSRLAGGASGAGVFGLCLAGQPVVLKVSTRPAAQGEAGRELRFYRELAGRVPVRTPALLKGSSGAGRDVLLLDRAQPPSPARDWTAEDWLDVARQLGELQASISLAELVEADWPDGDPGPPDVDARARLWHAAGVGDVTEALFTDLERLQQARTAPAPCLVHGDCHADNLLRDGAQRVWADWQVVGPGHGPEDLALLWQRAEYNGAVVPRSAFLATYAQARGLRVDADFEQAVTAAEIDLLLMGWPAFLLERADTAREVLVRRLRTLAATWNGSAANVS